MDTKYIQHDLGLNPGGLIIRLTPTIFFYLLSFNLLFLFVLNIFPSLIMLPDFQHAIRDDAIDIFQNLGLFLLSAGLVTPVVEEFIFRYFLVGNDFKKVLISLVLLLSMLSFSDWGFVDFVNLICLVYFLVMLFSFFVHNRISYNAVFFSSILCFGVPNLSNFNFEELIHNWFFIPLLILPQVVLGYIVSMLRIRFGLLYAVLYHGTYNVVLILIAYILYLLTGEVY